MISVKGGLRVLFGGNWLIFILKGTREDCKLEEFMLSTRTLLITGGYADGQQYLELLENYMGDFKILTYGSRGVTI